MALIVAGTHGTNAASAPSLAGKGLEVRSIGDLVRPGGYRLHSRFSHAVNFVGGNDLLAVVDSAVGAGPVNVVIDDVADWGIGHLEVRTGCIFAAGREILLQDAPRYDSSLHMPDVTDPAPFKANLTTLRDHLTSIAPEDSLAFLLGENPGGSGTNNFENALRCRFTEAVELLRSGRSRDAVTMVKGLGRGLTPQGDDFIAGLLFALHVRGRAFGERVEGQILAIGEAARSENPFSRAMLDCAAQGRAFARLKDLIQSLFGADRHAIETCAQELLAIGATSGADIATGLVFGLMRKF